MVLNTLHAPAPTTPDYQPYHTFTQDNVLDAGVAFEEPLNLVEIGLEDLGIVLQLARLH